MKLPHTSVHFKPPVADNPLGKVYFASIRMDAKGEKHSKMLQSGGYQLVLVLKGEGFYRDSHGRELRLGRGDLIIISPGVSHQCDAAKGSRWSRLTIMFSGPWFNSLFQSGQLQCQDRVIALSPIGPWYRKFYKLLRLNLGEAQKPIRYLNRFLAVLCEIPIEIQKSAPDQRPAWFTMAVSIIEAADPTQSLDITQISRKCKIGEDSLRKYFPRLMGYSPSEYHKNLRIKTACEMIAYGSESFKQIAQQLGYYDIFHFSKTFKEKTGLTPGQFKTELVTRNIKIIDSERVQKLALQEWFKAEEEKRLLEEKTAAERRRNWRLQVKEDFSDQDVASRWDITGKWEIRTGELRVWGKDGRCVTLKTPVPGDVRLVFDCHLESDYLSDISFFLGALHDHDKPVNVWSGYLFQFGGWENQRITLTSPDGVLWNRYDSPLVRGQSYHVDAQKIGNRLILKVDDQPIFDVRDPYPAFGSEHALLGLYSWGTDIRYANIQVYTRDAAAQADLLETAGDFMIRGDYHAAKSLFQEVISSCHDTQRADQARKGLIDASRLIALAAEFPSIQARLLKVWPTANIVLRSRGMMVDVRNAGINDLAPLQGLPLNELYCDHNQIATLQPLRGMKTLEKLSCGNNQIRSLEPLRAMNLIDLNCADNQISSLEPLQGMKLRTFRCYNNHIASLDSLLGMELDELACGSNRIQDLEPLRGMALTALSFSKNQVAHLEPLRGMLLSRLNCSWNQITDLEPLRKMKLSALRCSGNRITTLDPLHGTPLRFLQCAWNQIRELDPLRGIKLNILSCHDNPIKSLQPILEFLPKGLYVELDALEAGERKAIEARADQPGIVGVLRNAQILSLLKQIPQTIEKLKALAHVVENHRYLLVPLESTWMEAKKICEELGGHLAVIRNQKTADDLQARVTAESEFWIGLYAENQKLAWITGETCDFQKIDAKQIGSGAFYLNSYGSWTEDNRREKSHGFCVEWDEPSRQSKSRDYARR